MNGFTLDEYNSYSGNLPDDIQIALGFTLPGYYLIQFNGGANKYGESKRKNCGCGNYVYQNFLFESNIGNPQYLDLYVNSTAYTVYTSELNNSGAYFIKVE